MPIDQARYAQWAAACRFSPFTDAAYRAWTHAEASRHEAEQPTLRSELENLPYRDGVTFAIADSGSDNALRSTLASLSAQLCQRFDVVVACTPSRAEAVTHALSFVRDSIHVRLVAASAPASLRELQQLALEHTAETWFGVILAGDRLAPQAVSSIQFTLAKWPDAAVIYADEDWIAQDETRCKPRFKSAWDPEAQLGFDLLDGLCVMKRANVLGAGGFRAGFEPAASYDLHCRVAMPLHCSQVLHVPSVLYHRQVPPIMDAGDTRHAVEAHAAAARRVAAEAAFRQSGVAVDVLPSPIAEFVNHVRRPLPSPAPRVSILVPTRDRANLVKTCLDGLLQKTDYPDFEVLILDNDSIEPATLSLFAELRADPRVSVLRVPGPFNFSTINNVGVQASTGEVLLFLNNDIEILDGGWLREMVGEVMRPDIGCVGAKLLYGDGTVQHAGVILQRGPLAMHVCRTDGATDTGVDGRLAGTRDYLAVTGACLAVRRSVFEQVGGFDSEHLPVAYNDVDLCLKVNDAGYRNICTPFASLLHLESASRGHDHVSEEKQKRAQREQTHASTKWIDRFEHDPYHNPNVLLDWLTGAHLAPNVGRQWQLAR
ncbi:glycosyltransferase family 2 protein [Variovorax paradoxus]|uniref:glycosyltransferase family 2 protein n=1 Tax=Variovorax paradoxus TaxID=34073 RepID=UPI001E3EED64|nr:glycosyltransferase family 2 protein [Variovorax paradoxus]